MYIYIYIYNMYIYIIGKTVNLRIVKHVRVRTCLSAHVSHIQFFEPFVIPMRFMEKCCFPPTRFCKMMQFRIPFVKLIA